MNYKDKFYIFDKTQNPNYKQELRDKFLCIIYILKELDIYSAILIIHKIYTANPINLGCLMELQSNQDLSFTGLSIWYRF